MGYDLYGLSPHNPKEIKKPESPDWKTATEKEQDNFFRALNKYEDEPITISENIQNRIFIKLGKNFNKISLTDTKKLSFSIQSRSLENIVKAFRFPMLKNFSFLCSNISSLVYFLNSSKYFINISLVEKITCSLFRCAPPIGSFITSSIIFIFKSSFEVNFIALAASNDLLGSLHNMEAQPSGDITEQIAFSNIKTLFADAKAIAPPEPPSPIIIEIIGTFSDIQHSIELAIASACPLCSAPIPGQAPGVSTNDITVTRAQLTTSNDRVFANGTTVKKITPRTLTASAFYRGFDGDKTTFELKKDVNDQF